MSLCFLIGTGCDQQSQNRSAEHEGRPDKKVLVNPAPSDSAETPVKTKPENLNQLESVFLTIGRRYRQHEGGEKRIDGDLRTVNFDFAAFEEVSKGGLSCQMKKESESRFYFEIADFFGSGRTIELHTEKLGSLWLYFLHERNTTAISKDLEVAERRTSGRFNGVPGFPNIPGCFVRDAGAKHLLYLGGLDWDGTAFEKPFSSFGQLLNIFLCDGRLQPQNRIWMSRGQGYILGKFEIHRGRLIEYVTGLGSEEDGIAMAQLSLDSVFNLFDRDIPGDSVVEVLVEDLQLPCWFPDAGLVQTHPSMYRY